MNTFSLVVGFSLAIGVGMIANTIISIIFETGRRLSRPVRRGRLHALGLGNKDQSEEKRTEEAIPGIGDIPWGSLYAGAALIGLVLLAVLGPHLPGIRLGFLALPGLVWLAKRYLIQQRKRFLVGQIRQFLMDVRLHMSLQGSLLLGLESIGQNHPGNISCISTSAKAIEGQFCPQWFGFTQPTGGRFEITAVAAGCSTCPSCPAVRRCLRC